MKKCKKVVISLLVIYTFFATTVMFVVEKNDLKSFVKQSFFSESYSLDGVWKENSLNPIIGDAETGSLFDPWIIQKDDGTYIMYVSWRKEKNIAYTTSEDGEHWSDLRVALERDADSGWEEQVNRCSVVYYGDKYYMYYTGLDNGISRIGIASSDDGYNFERIQDAPIVLPDENWEGHSVMNPSVMIDNGVFKMWYSAGETYEPDVICYATSMDGVTWQKFNYNPIFSKTTDWYSSNKVAVGQVIKHDNLYYMFFIGYQDVDTARVCVATSINGITNWEIYENNPIVNIGKSNSWNQHACYKPTVLYDEKSNTWRIWYNGRSYSNEYIGMSSFEGDFLEEVKE